MNSIYYMKHLYIGLSVLTHTITSEMCDFSQVSYDQRLKTGIFHTYINSSGSCARNCMLTTDCKSFNLNRYTGICELSSDTAASYPEQVVYSKEWIQSDITAWLKTWIGACAKVTCPPRHTCINLASGETTCMISECPPLPIANVSYSKTNYTTTERGVGTTSTYECISGFNLQGTADVTCKSDGSWTSPNFTCKAFECPANWNQRNDSCYFLVLNFKATYTEAESYCEHLVPGGHIVEFEDSSENTYVSSIWKDYSTYSRPFIGAAKVSGQLIWVKTQTPLTFTSWYPGEPNGGNVETCVNLWEHEKWNDISCSSLQYFICEVEATVIQ